MLSSKLILMTVTWVMAFLASISLRAAGIAHPEPFDINHFLVWFLVFGPSFFILIYFFFKKSFSLDSLI